MDISIREAERQMAILSRKIAKLKIYQDTYNDLAKFVELGRKILSSKNGSASIMNGSENPKPTTASIAERILIEREESLSSDELRGEMIVAGWNACGDRKKDNKKLYIALTRYRELFQRDSDLKWGLKRAKTPDLGGKP